MKPTLQRIFRHTLESLDLSIWLDPKVPRDLERVSVFAFGKAALKMAEVAGYGGIAVAPEVRRVPGYLVLPGEHPYPGPCSFAAGSALLAEASQLREHDTALFLVSGGGSAMVEESLRADLDVAAIHERLVTGGASIVEMNIVRKHISAFKGGRLAAAAAPARQITLYVSDVPAGHDDAVASGPTMPDPSTLQECRAIASRLGIALPHDLPETPKPGDPCFDRSEYCCVLSGVEAVRTLARHAADEGWEVATDLADRDQPVDAAVDRLLARLEQLKARHPDRTVAVVSGGEVDCPVTGDGIGGRNATFVLRCAQRIAGKRIAVLSAGTDGIDGNSPAAGAVADGETVGRGLDPWEFDARSDAYTFFQRLGDAVVTGPTENNVRDLRILVAY